MTTASESRDRRSVEAAIAVAIASAYEQQRTQANQDSFRQNLGLSSEEVVSTKIKPPSKASTQIRRNQQTY
jgi:hypothetical protein